MKVGSTCIDTYEASVWRIDPAHRNELTSFAPLPAVTSIGTNLSLKGPTIGFRCAR